MKGSHGFVMVLCGQGVCARLPPNNEMLGHLRHALAFASLTHMLMVNVNGIAEVKYGGRMYACYGKGRVSEEGD